MQYNPVSLPRYPPLVPLVMEHPEYQPEPELSAEEFAHQVNQDPAEALRHYRELQNQARSNLNATPVSSVPPAPSPPSPMGLDAASMQAIAAIIAQAISSQPPPVIHLPTNPVSSTVPRSEKLPDIPQYEGDKDQLDAWEQNLIQRMDVNHDRYPTARAKIAYAESRLTIGKKAHNLMEQYRVNGLCIIASFPEWRSKLRHCCGNPFEAEDARIYLRETLKQGSGSFDEYYNLFYQKKERSQMENASLVDCMKRNVNYSTQVAAMSWRTKTGHRPTTFDEWVSAYSETDEELQQLKHRQPRNASSVAAPTKPKTSTVPLAAVVKAVPVVPVAPTASMVVNDPMDLSSAMAAVQGKSLKIPGVKDICTKWKLCYYCKLQHPGKTAKECPNKSASTLRVVDLDDNLSIDGGVSLDAGKV